MAKKSNLSLEPQHIDKHNWYYEERGGIVFVHEVYIADQYCQTDQVKIPWRKLRRSLARKDGVPEVRK